MSVKLNDIVDVSNKPLECLKYLHEMGLPLSVDVCLFAAERGLLECLKYLHENGCPCHEEACSQATLNGHLECLKYARDNGCVNSNMC